MMEASGVHRLEALTRQAVGHVSPLACTVGPHGFLKEASRCRIEAACDIGIEHVSGVYLYGFPSLLHRILA